MPEFREIDRAEHSRALGQSLFADRILMTLAKVESVSAADEDAQSSLREASAFLHHLAETAESMRPEMPPTEFVTAAHLVESTWGALDVEKWDLKAVLEKTMILAESCSRLAENQVASPDLAVCKEFFVRYGHIEHERSREHIGAVSREQHRA